MALQKLFQAIFVEIIRFFQQEEGGIVENACSNVKHGVGQWKKAIQEQAKALFEGKRGPKAVAAHREPELLFSEIGKLKVELDWLKKKSGISR